MSFNTNFRNKVVLITGATGQLGRQYCAAFSRCGATVIVSDLELSKCKDIAKDLIGNHIPIQMDVSDPEAVKNNFDNIEKDFSRIDIIVNNAGIAVFDPFEERSFDDFMRVFKVNVGGTFLCIKEGSRLMRKHNIQGSIINIGSIYGIVSGDPRIYAVDSVRKTSECYGASKAAIIQMTKYFAVHLAPYGIRVNCISPGGVYKNQSKDFVNKYSHRTPMNRMAEDNELAETAIFLASSSSSYITGQNIIVDGGWTAW